MNDSAPQKPQINLQLASIRARRALALLWVNFVIIAAGFIGKNICYAVAAATRKSIKGFTLTKVFLIGESPVQIIAGIVAVILLLMWLHRYVKNLLALGVTGFRFSPGWSVGWFFIPVMNWFMPYRIIREAWLASTPQQDTGNWRDARPPLFIMWWFLTALGMQFFSFTSQMGRLPGFGPGWWMTYILGLAAVGLLIHLIHELEQRIQIKHQIVAQAEL
jgi:hypothetical protein